MWTSVHLVPFTVISRLSGRLTEIGQHDLVKPYIGTDRFKVAVAPHMKKPSESDVLISLSELAQVVGIDFETANNWIRRGIISRSAIGGRQLRNRLFSMEEVYKAALKYELVKLGIGPSPASDATDELWKHWPKIRIVENSYAILIPKNGQWICLLCTRDSSTGNFFKLQSSPTGKTEKVELPQQTFAVIPIHNVYSQVTENLSTLLD